MTKSGYVRVVRLAQKLDRPSAALRAQGRREVERNRRPLLSSEDTQELQLVTAMSRPWHHPDPKCPLCSPWLADWWPEIVAGRSPTFDGAARLRRARVPAQ